MLGDIGGLAGALSSIFAAFLVIFQYEPLNRKLADTLYSYRPRGLQDTSDSDTDYDDTAIGKHFTIHSDVSFYCV